MNAEVPSAASHEWDTLSFQERYRSSVGGSASRDGKKVMAAYRFRLILTDAWLVTGALVVGLLVSSRQSVWMIDPLLAIYGAPVAIGVLWLGMLMLRGSYDQRLIGVGPEEFRRVAAATLYTFAVVAGLSYLVRADISRAYAYVSLPLGMVAIVIARYAWRKWLYRQRYHGRFLIRTVVIGETGVAEALADRLTQDAYAGYEVVGRMGLPGDDETSMTSWLASIDALLAEERATAVAIDPGDDAPHNAVRDLAWRLEGRGIDLLISPGPLDVAGPRLSVRPAAGLPLLHLDEAALSRPQRFAKRALDLAGSISAIVVLSPVLLTCAIAVRLTSPGPVIFRQARIGRAGRPFTMFKFRSMHTDADEQREALRAKHGISDPMFKLAEDPRVTKVGGVLRRWSLDELPQLFNVLGGAMSLVGPRPHPIDDVDRYGVEAFRRLALKPGMTGLWQVEGRSDLSWTDALRLDLYYVERWTLAGDAVLMLRTLRAVIQGRGAH